MTLLRLLYGQFFPFRVENNITNPKSRSISWEGIEIVLLEASSGKSHPDACEPRIIVKDAPWQQDGNHSITIFGDILALAFVSTEISNIYIFHWKTGVLKMVHPGTYLEPLANKLIVMVRHSTQKEYEQCTISLADYPINPEQ